MSVCSLKMFSDFQIFWGFFKCSLDADDNLKKNIYNQLVLDKINAFFSPDLWSTKCDGQTNNM